MELYLLRHGIAADRDAQRFPNDSQRPLTAEGIKRTRKVAKAMAAMKLKFDLVLTSPFVRAKQTADIVTEVLEIPQRLRLCHPLAPAGRAKALVTEMNRLCKADDCVLLVGHEPDLSQLVSLWISGKPGCDLTFKKAGLCKLAVTELTAGRCASLEWLSPPRLLLRSVK